MAKRKVEWSKDALLDLVEIMNYYYKRNKSSTYSQKLSREIKFKLNTLDVSISLPQITSAENLFYFTHNHISVCFEIIGNDLKVQLVIDDRRNPLLIAKLLKNLE